MQEAIISKTCLLSLRKYEMNKFSCWQSLMIFHGIRLVKLIWGPVTLSWVVSKTYQHTAEHTGDILRIALFWDSWL